MSPEEGSVQEHRVRLARRLAIWDDAQPLAEIQGTQRDAVESRADDEGSREPRPPSSVRRISLGAREADEPEGDLGQ